ncbi:hypothetical protein [Salinilacihabitans rarus]|uniref:hypothetical protein n=1 Tax=Salinilacihabitans rarus TaxID=2961596 RepID=UPI0020C929DD|nr:hypothetical protein [Salinilacihabitans rarus]
MAVARANGGLVRVRGAEGRVRLEIDDRWRLREKIDSYRRTVDSPRRDLIGLANRRVQQLRERELSLSENSTRSEGGEADG